MQNMHPRRTWLYAGILSLAFTGATFIWTFISDIPSISPADVNGCSLPRAFGFPFPFVFYREPFIHNSCDGYVVSMGFLELTADLAIWLAIAFFLVLAIGWLRTKS